MQKVNLSCREPRAPFLTIIGNFLKEPEQTGVTLQKLMSNSNLSEEGKQEFLDFLCTMLKVLPQDRKTAGELLDHPWLRKEYQVPLADPEDSS